MIPAFFDQMSNAAILADLGVGLVLDVRKITQNEVFDALNNIVNDKKWVSFVFSGLFMNEICRFNSSALSGNKFNFVIVDGAVGYSYPHPKAEIIPTPTQFQKKNYKF